MATINPPDGIDTVAPREISATTNPDADTAAPPATLTQTRATEIVSNSATPEGESLIAPTTEPPPHESTKVEVTQLKDPEVKDFGWNSKPNAVPTPLIKGLANEDLYTLLRRFDKVSRMLSSAISSILTPCHSNCFM